MERYISLYIMLFGNHFRFQKSGFVILSILGDELDNNVQIYFLQKNVCLTLECIFSFEHVNFVIWQVACEYIYSLKPISLTCFRSIL